MRLAIFVIKVNSLTKSSWHRGLNLHIEVPLPEGTRCSAQSVMAQSHLTALLALYADKSQEATMLKMVSAGAQAIARYSMPAFEAPARTAETRSQARSHKLPNMDHRTTDVRW
jgi:hypothetical protein